MTRLTKIIAVLLVLLAVVLGVFAVLLGMRPAPQSARPLPPAVSRADEPRQAVPVVVAARAVPAGRPLAPEDLRVADWEVAPGGAFASPEALLGRTLRLPLAENEAVTAVNLATGLGMQVAAGERAIAVALDEVAGVAQRIRPGDWVDVFFTLPRVGTDVQRSQARLLLSRVRVLAYGAESIDSPATPDAAATRRDAAAPRTAVLAVPVAHVNDVLLAAGHGQLRLVLRHPADTATADASLFPEPRPVLAAREGLASADLARLDAPENRAFAGLDVSEFGGPAPAAPAMAAAAPAPARSRPVARPSAPRNTVEIVRGTQSRLESY